MPASVLLGPLLVSRVSWAGVEVLHQGEPVPKVGWAGLEVLHDGAPSAQVTWAGVEVLHSLPFLPYGTRQRADPLPRRKAFPRQVLTIAEDTFPFFPPPPSNVEDIFVVALW